MVTITIAFLNINVEGGFYGGTLGAQGAVLFGETVASWEGGGWLRSP